MRALDNAAATVVTVVVRHKGQVTRQSGDFDHVTTVKFFFSVERNTVATQESAPVDSYAAT